MKEKPLFSGKVAFTLYDTYGFPLDLTQMILREKGIEVDVDEFNIAMQEQKDRSRANWVGSGDKKTNDLYLKIEDKCEFLGYNETKTNATILKLIKNGDFVDEIQKGDEVEIVTDKTVLYGESGGQVGDSGLIILLNKENLSIPLPFSIIQVNDTKKTANGLIIQKGIVELGSFKVGDLVNITFNAEKRRKIKANHSATHLLHYAIRTVLGDTVTQKGSYVDDKRLRLDVACDNQISAENLSKIEEIVNSLIIQNTPIKTELMGIEEAKKTGAMALFGEKYGKQVRVVSMGLTKVKEEEINSSENALVNSLSSLSDNKKEKYCSIEFCGGTHTEMTGNIGFFKITKEESIASGVRRIEAVTGIEALKFVNNKVQIINAISENFKVSDSNILEKIDLIVKENKNLKKQISDLEKSKISDIVLQEKEFNGLKFGYKILDSVNPQDAKNVLLSWFNGKYKDNSIAILICKNNGKNTIIVGISKNITDKYNAVDILKKLGGNGGGQPHFAMGSIKEIPNDFDCVFLK